MEFFRTFNDFALSPCFAESIGVLLVKIGRTVEKLFGRKVFDKTGSAAHRDWNFEKLGNFQFCFPCFAESIGVALVRIGRTVKMLLTRGVFYKSCSIAPLD
jgi:hypothetical protein